MNKSNAADFFIREGLWAKAAELLVYELNWGDAKVEAYISKQSHVDVSKMRRAVRRWFNTVVAENPGVYCGPQSIELKVAGKLFEMLGGDPKTIPPMKVLPRISSSDSDAILLGWEIWMSGQPAYNFELKDLSTAIDVAGIIKYKNQPYLAHAIVGHKDN